MHEGGLGGLVAIDAVGAGRVDVPGEGVLGVIEPTAHHLQCSGQRELLASRQAGEIDGVQGGDTLGEGSDDLLGPQIDHR